MPTDLMRASAPPASRPASARNFNIVAIALTALVALQLVGLALLERSHAHAMQMSFPREASAWTDGPDAAAPQSPYD